MSALTVSTVATVALAVVAAAALGTNVWLMRLTRRALDATVDSVREERRARIDARSPRVVVYEAPQPVWPPAHAQSVVTPHRHNLTSGMRFDLPGEAATRLLVSAYVCLHNEGEASAFLTMPPGSVRVANQGDRPDEEGEEVLNWALGHKLSYRLAPNESRWFLLESGHTVEEWAVRWRQFDGDIASTAYGSEPDAIVPGVRFAIEIKDQFIRSFRDVLIVDILAFPIAPLAGSADSWAARTAVALTLDTVAVTHVVGIDREYDEQ